MRPHLSGNQAVRTGSTGFTEASEFWYCVVKVQPTKPKNIPAGHAGEVRTLAL
jgi:hypothetical protein